MESVLKFFADLLTDKMDETTTKEKALELYVELRMPKVGVPLDLVFNIPGSTRVLHISPANYEHVRSLVHAEQKIAAIKHLRATSFLDGDRNLGAPSLKEAKDFVEQHSWGL